MEINIENIMNNLQGNLDNSNVKSKEAIEKHLNEECWSARSLQYLKEEEGFNESDEISGKVFDLLSKYMSKNLLEYKDITPEGGFKTYIIDCPQGSFGYITYGEFDFDPSMEIPESLATKMMNLI